MYWQMYHVKQCELLKVIDVFFLIDDFDSTLGSRFWDYDRNLMPKAFSGKTSAR